MQQPYFYFGFKAGFVLNDGEVATICVFKDFFFEFVFSFKGLYAVGVVSNVE